MDSLTKSPLEVIPGFFGFSTDLAPGETVASIVLTCVDSSDGSDSMDEIVSGYAIVSPDVRVVYQGGTEDDEHHVQCVATTNLGNIFQRDLVLFVQIVIDETFTKQPDDSFPFELDFTRRLEPGDSLQSATASAINEQNGISAAVVSDPTVISPFVTVPVLGGIDGSIYRISILGTTVASYVYEKFLRMNVREY